MIGTYLIDAGTILSIFFKTAQFQQISIFLITLGTALNNNQGTVGPVRLGNSELTVTITPVA
jgi:hypothetical protein